jgi:hypothetical protein
MKGKAIIISFIFLFVFLFFVKIEVAGEKNPEQTIKTLRSTRALKEPVLDGRLDDLVWQREPDVDDTFITYSPVSGNVFPQKTRVWLANDSMNLYFAFYCYDTEPGKIKSSITKHDNMWNDDWIGFNLDTIGDKRNGYVLCVNPNGIQGDLYDSTATGVDFSPDYVWYSTGKIVKDGYIIEMRVPLSSIKYTSGKNVAMNIIFERSVTRLGLMGSWPQVPAGKGFFAGMTRVIYDELESQRKFEAIPSITYGSLWDREEPGTWSEGDDSTNVGITAKYMITSSIAAEAAINPDFSQVETDDFQVLANQRYPIFYSEKRPFFMEASKIFNIAGSSMGDKNLITAVHTRRIVDPLWGAKVGGQLKGFSFGLLAAADEWPGRKFDPEIDGAAENPFDGKKAAFIIGRTKVGVGGDNYIGAIITNRNFAEGYNRIIGSDMYLRFGGGNHFFRSHFLYSSSKNESTLEKTHGSALTLSYEFHSKPFDIMSAYEYFDQDFNMYTAFIRRKGLSKFTSQAGVNFYPQSGKFSWITRITSYVLGYYLHDTITGEDDYLLKGGISFNFIKSGYFSLRYQTFGEYWAGQTFKGGLFETLGGIQLTKWLNLSAYFMIGENIYYHPVDPLLGDGISYNFQMTIQPNDKLSQYFLYLYQGLDRKSDGERLYDVDILISRTTYQVNRYLFLRAIFQYDSYLETILSDALISFTLIPGTVLHIGYGSLHEKLGWEDNRWYNYGPMRKYYQTSQSLFLKASYLFRF